MQKLLLIFYDHGIDQDMLELFDHLAVEGFTRITDAHGKGHSGKRFGDPIFPGSVNMALIALPEEQVPDLLEALRNLESLFRKKPPIRVLGLGTEVLY